MVLNATNTRKEHRILIAGSGGQGILSLGKLLCNAAISEGANATYMPSYGTEVRGGTCNCHIVISPDEIFSPYVETADSLIIMNQMSHDRFRHMLDPRGLLIYNSSMVKLPDEARNNQDQQIRGLDAMDMAGDLGNELVANVILLGGFIAITGICRVESMEEAITTWLKPNKASQIELNLNALHKGVESVTADA